MSKRNDIHIPSRLIPADYRHILTFAYSSATVVWAYNIDRLRELRETKPFFKKPNGKGGCDVCGANYASGDVFVHVPTGEHIAVGWECAGKIEANIDRSEALREIGKLKAAALAAVARAEKQEGIKLFLAKHEGLGAALNFDHRISRDLYANLHKWGSLSDKQVALALKIVADASKPEKPKTEVPFEGGRHTITGTVISLKDEPSDYGWTTKMLVEVDTLHGSYRVYGTKPASISPRRGDRVTFTASLKQSRNDMSFGFFSRPAQAACEAVEAPGAAGQL